VRAAAANTLASVLGATGLPADRARALELVDATLADPAAGQNVLMILGARLTRATVDAPAGSAARRAALLAVEEDARALGLESIARRAAAAAKR
jgi:hypothetical protein